MEKNNTSRFKTDLQNLLQKQGLDPQKAEETLAEETALPLELRQTLHGLLQGASNQMKSPCSKAVPPKK